ncbi:DUF11 domain-containing protein [Deinococcus detaillensis]|uniref:DUF11 domain-containing protein n=1 Tax=Deinococcus detaillensis TaxID=2592048 RepID=A0A553V2U3_9DEIO|nr:SdrD B-like domain-containing protein [Deinococcus detaillensis]TSA86785.1 DUF11 domain-containing protein [Deinococcus detaillensis]
MRLPRLIQPRSSAPAVLIGLLGDRPSSPEVAAPVSIPATQPWLLRLALTCAALSGGVASASTTFGSLCQEQGGTLSPNLITAESGGTFGSIARTSPPTYRDLESADRPGSPYSYTNNTDGTGRIRPEGTYAVTSSYGSGNLLDVYGPWQAYTGHTNGGGTDAYLAVNGAVSQATFLNQTIAVERNTNYEIGLWGRSPHAASSAYGGSDQAAKLSISAGGLANGVTNNLVRGDDWERGSIIFNSGNQTSVPVSFKNISTVAEGNDFYVDDLFLQKCVVSSGTISGKVYRDNNGNASQDGGEPGIQNVAVKATDKNGSVATVTTGSDGSYSFPNLSLGNKPYKIEVVAASAPLSGLTATTPTSTSGVSPQANITVPGGNFGYKPPTPTIPDSGTCTVSTPYIQSFNRSGPLAEARNHDYLSNADTVTSTTGTYTLWNQIDHSGNNGYGLYYNVANFENKNGGNLSTPGLIYESRITVPAGSTIGYENYVRSHSNSATQLQYRFYDGVSGSLLKSVNGAVVTTDYTRQIVDGFVSPSDKVVLRIYTLKDGTSADANVVKLDDIKVTCPVPATLDLKVEKTGPATANVGEVFSFTVTSSNVSQGTALNVVTTDTLPAGLNFVSADNGGTYNAPSRTVTWPTVASLAPNAKQVYSVSVSADVVSAGQSLTNVAKVATPTPETDLTNNTDQATVKITNPTVPVPDSGTCTTAAPYLQTFNSGGPLVEVRNHRYLSDANTVTNTDGTYTVWNQIDHTGNGGSALYYNIANFENKNGGNLTIPGLLYESQITVPAGSTISYENYVRSHSNTATQIQYRFYDGVTNTLLQTYNGALATTDYTKQSVPSFVSPSNKVIIRLYTLKDGTTADLNVLKLDDIKLTCPLPVAALSITKTHIPATFQVLQAGLYNIKVSNAAGSAPTSGVITVKDQLPVGIGAALPSGFSPAAGWTCTYSGEAEQGVGYAPNPNEAQLLTCTTTNVLASGSSVNLSIPVNVTPKAGSSVVNKASVGGGGDTDPIPDPATCTVGARCAQDIAPVTPLPLPPATCSTGTPTNLLASPITGYQDNDNATLQSDGKLITDAAAYSTGTGPSGSFVIDGTYYFNNGYGPVSKASTLQLIVNGTVYASFLTEDAYSGRASVVPSNGASLEGGAASLTLNRYTSSKIWVTLPSSVKSISSVQVKFISNASGGGVSDDYGFTVANALACTQPAPPKALLDKTVQNITANGPVTRDSLGKPGDVLEYCLTASNIGNTSVTKLGLGDNIPASTTAQVGGYGTGKDVKYTLPDGSTKFLTFAADGDAAQLGKDTNGITPRLFVNDTTLTLAPSKSFIVCFRATIN